MENLGKRRWARAQHWSNNRNSRKNFNLLSRLEWSICCNRACFGRESFARYKEMDKREFAEYVLIGTLISTVLAIISAGAIQLLLPPNPATWILHYL